MSTPLLRGLVVSSAVLATTVVQAQPRGRPTTEVNPYATTAEENPYGDTVAPENPYATEPDPDDVPRPSYDPSSDPRRGTDEPSPQDTGTEAAPSEDAADDAASVARQKLIGVSFGFHSTSFATENRFGYSLMGLQVGATYFVGRTWGFALRGEASFPLFGRMASQGRGIDFRTSLTDDYGVRRFGFDGLVMAARRVDLSDSLQLLVGAGLHAQSFRLISNVYRPIEAVTFGVGGMARLDYLFHDVLSLGAEFAFGLDPLDLVRHDNRAVITFPASVGISLGVRR